MLGMLKIFLLSHLSISLEPIFSCATDLLFNSAAVEGEGSQLIYILEQEIIQKVLGC